MHRGGGQSGGTQACPLPLLPVMAVGGGAHWALSLGPSQILTVPAVTSPCWPLPHRLLPEPWLLPFIRALCPQPSALWGLPRLALGHIRLATL